MPPDSPNPPSAAPSSLVYLQGMDLAALVALPPDQVLARLADAASRFGGDLDGLFLNLPSPSREGPDDELTVRVDAIRAILPYRPSPPARGERPGLPGHDHVQRVGI